ncbi:MAG: hypothetical protein ACLP62_14895 [Acidimicrobiales bacterium]
MESDAISQAVVVWTGWGHTAWPARDDERLVEKFGEAGGLDLVPKVHALQEQFYESYANLKAHDLVEMGSLASERFRQLHPELANDAVEALAWCYTFDFK